MIDEVERTTGKPVVLRPEPGLAGKAHAAYAASDLDQSRHLVLYDPAFETYLNHLVPHELGHVQLFATAERDDRLLPHLGQAERLASRTALGSQLSNLTRSLLESEGDANALLDLWSDGAVMQVANYPQDILIERMIFENHPRLRSSQRASLTLIARESHAGLNARVLALTPRSVSLASHAMNYALLKSVSSYLGEPWMVRPYRGTSFERIGEELLDLFAARSSDELTSCTAVSREWSQHLGIVRWFSWGPAQSDDRTSRHLWER